MKSGGKRIAYLLILSVFILGLLTGCRHSPLLEKVIYVDRVQKSEPQQQEKKPEPPKEEPLIAETVVPRDVPVETPEASTGPGLDMTGGEGDQQIATEGAITVVVPQSMYMVTTVTETTRNPHWKRNIDYASSRYTGDRVNGIFEGVGTYVWDDGEKYEGNWSNGMYNGQGTYTWINGEKYEGEWKTEAFEGQGKYTWPSGSYYEGEWKGGVKEGHGVYSWANGDRYEGEWKAGVKEGQGTYTWADGSVYEGEWKYGIKEGQGTYRGADGTVYQGLWANDKFVGQ